MIKILKGSSASDVSSQVQRQHLGSKLAIEVSDLFKKYPRSKANAVDGVSFSVRRGEIFGLLGPNGAGKTTTIGILTTQIRPTGGIARIMDIDVASDPMRVKQRISVVPQRNNLDESIRAREVLTFHASYHGVPRVERERRADVLLAEFGLEDRGKKMVSTFSGGMAQRLLLARALMHSPDVLFLDEPTNSLDPQSRLFLWERIRALNERGVTVLLTTHDMHEADQLCGRIAIMDKGHILVIDTAEELKKRFTGGSWLELRIWLPKDVSPSSIQTALSRLPDVTKVQEIAAATEAEKQTDVYLFHLHAANVATLVASVVHAITAMGAELRHLHLSHPTLEDVFISLTGRNLRS